MLQNLFNIFNSLNFTDLTTGEDKQIIEDDLLFVFTSTTNQKLNEDKNNITMDLGECEYLLKKDYNVSINDSLYILQIISEEEGMRIPKIEYEVYYPLYSSNNLTKLNLSSCKDTKIEISIAVKINDTLDKHNSSSGYYNNICYKTTSESGTDISLKDRRNEFVDNNMTLCEENCELIDYNYEKGKAKCSCDVKLSIPENYDFKFDKKDFFKSFIDIKNIANINILKCYKDVLEGKNLAKNYGFYIITFILLFYFITLNFFWIKSFDNLKKDIKNMIHILKNIKEENNVEEKKEERIIKKSEKQKKRKKKNNKGYDYYDNNDNNKQIELKFKKSKIENKKGRKSKNFNKEITPNVEYKSIKMINKKEITELKDVKDAYTKELMEQKDFELNSLDYEEAIKLDHRSLFQFYISLIKNNHPLIFSFACINDYNPRIIKIFLFLFSFSLDFTINALFFNDDTMHKIYEDKGKFNFLYQIPQILYSTLISKFIDTLIKYLALSQDNFVDLKQEDKKNLNKKYREKFIRTLKIKFILFFLITFIILGFFWYYITCFCGIYINTQIHLISDSLISLITSFFYPFIMLLVPGIFRISSIRVKKPTRKFLYKFSSIIENILG